MKYIINHSNDTAFNIALEEYAFKHLLDEDQIFLLWINKPSIIVGRHQNTIEEINRDYVRENGIEVVRRISGGGAVYHDLNNLNYTIISKEDENKAFDFKSFSTPVINTLAELGVKAEFTGRNDLEIDGKKFCGNAQAYINGRIMHHGCLLFDVDLSVLANALKVSKDKFESKGVKSVRARVTNIIDELPEKITVEEFRDLLLEYMKKEYPEMTEYVFQMKNWLKSIVLKILSLELGIGTMVNHQSITSVVELNSQAVRLKSLLMLLSQKFKTSRFTVTFSVSKMLQQ